MATVQLVSFNFLQWHGIPMTTCLSDKALGIAGPAPQNSHAQRHTRRMPPRPHCRRTTERVPAASPAADATAAAASATTPPAAAPPAAAPTPPAIAPLMTHVVPPVPPDLSSLVVISEVGDATPTTCRRRDHLLGQLGVQRLDFRTIPCITDDPDRHRVLFELLTRKLRLLLSTDFEVGVVCQDDTHFHDDLLTELGATLAALPAGWRCLHMCPGFLWGRKRRSSTEAGALDPERSVAALKRSPCGRFFHSIQDPVYKRVGVWPGGPVCFAVRRSRAAELLADLEAAWVAAGRRQHAEVLLLRVAGPDDFMAAAPQLCLELEQGGSTFRK